MNSKSGFTVYKYIPAAGYRGTDEVLISDTKISEITGSGCSNNPGHIGNSNNTTITSTSYTTIRLNITN